LFRDLALYGENIRQIAMNVFDRGCRASKMISRAVMRRGLRVINFFHDMGHHPRGGYLGAIPVHGAGIASRKQRLITFKW
jgi:hypothetical protein